MGGHEAGTILESYVNRDLRNVPRDELQALTDLIGVADDTQARFGFRPWYVWKSGDRDSRYIVFEGFELLMIPGDSQGSVHILDGDGRQMNSWTFSTGFRIQIVDARFTWSEELGTDLLTVQSVAAYRGRDVQKQIFAISDGVLTLVRLEDSNGKAIPNNYSQAAYTIGPSVDVHTENHWITLLNSESPVDVLTALMFLGGEQTRLDPHAQPGSGLRTDLSEVHHQLLSNRVVMDQINKHRHSTVKWVRDAANLIPPRWVGWGPGR